MTITDDGLIAGEIYKFRYRAVNSYGAGTYSEETDVGVAAFPAQPNAVT
jgi:hypothetical protein